MTQPRTRCLRSKQESYLTLNSEFAVTNRSTNPVHSIQRYPSESRPTRSKINKSKKLTDPRQRYRNNLRKLAKCGPQLFPLDLKIDLYPNLFRNDAVAKAY